MSTWTPKSLVGPTLRAAAIVAALQLAVLTYLVWSRVSLLSSGREITVDVIPVDPRDVFRGDYVVLGYGFSTTAVPPAGPTAEGTVAPAEVLLPEGSYRNAPVYVTLAPLPGEGAGWQRVKIDSTYPSTVEPGNIVLKGRVDHVWPSADGKSRQGQIRYGIESYFVPEGEGRVLEKAVREKKVRAVLAVGGDGTAALKALEVDGKRIHEQAAL